MIMDDTDLFHVLTSCMGCRSHRDEFECFLGEDFDMYLTSMARLGTWGDELTLVGHANLNSIVCLPHLDHFSLQSSQGDSSKPKEKLLVIQLRLQQ
jgi:hypothetical protein